MSRLIAFAAALLFGSANACATATIGATAADFSLADSSGKVHALSDY